MYLLSIFAVVLVSLFMMVTSGDVSMHSWTYFVDAVSVLILVLFCVPILISSGLGKDFNNAFRLAMKTKGDTSLREVKRAIGAVILIRRTLLASGAFATMFSMVLIMTNIEEPAQLGPNLCVAILTMLYALAAVIILLPLESRLKARLADMLEH